MNDGFINEKVLKEYIDGKYFCDFNENIQNFLSFTFQENLNTNEVFIAEKPNSSCAKPDLCIRHNNITKFISIKKGAGNSVHQEKIDLFFPFLSSFTPIKELNILKLFHYGDGTLNDTGKIRLSSSEVQEKYPSEIEKLNNFFNLQCNLRIFLDRFLFKGNVSFDSVDIIYHGDLNFGLWASSEEIINYILNNTFFKNTVHFGPLTYQVWGRNNNFEAVHPERRYVMQVKWGSLSTDLKNITIERKNKL